MDEIMIRLLNMSFAAGCTVLLVLILRLMIRRLPKSYSYALWLIVLFRFLCPVVIPSPVSLFPVNPEPVKPEIVYQSDPTIDTGVIWIDRAVNRAAGESLAVKNPENSINPIQVWLAAGFLIWGLGMAVSVGYYLFQFVKLYRRLKDAASVVTNNRTERRGIRVMESDRIDGAFVLGIFRPIIYLPVGMDQENREYVLRHEIVHVRRKDYLIRTLGLMTVIIHWFNPFSRIGFRMMCADMEMSCDEQVLGELGADERKAYSRVLLAQAEQKSGIMPLAFGRNSTYRRIQNILAYHKPGMVLTAAAVIIVTAAGVGLVTSPKEVKSMGEDPGSTSISIIGGADGPTSIFLAGKVGEEEEPAWQEERPDSRWLASVQVRGVLDNQEERETSGLSSEIFLDFASEQELIFHGDFGMFSFEKDSGGRWKQKIFISDVETGDSLAQALKMVLPKESEMSSESIHSEEILRRAQGFEEESEGDFFDTKFSKEECAAGKMADGRIAVLGAWVSGNGDRRLVDLYYGYYDPEENQMNQVFLFWGDGEEIANPAGEISEGRWLFERDGHDYYLRTPRQALEFEQTEYSNYNPYHIPYGRMELARSRDGQDELIDSLIYMESDKRQKMVLTEERIICYGFAEASVVAVKRPVPVSISPDGTDRRAGKMLYGVSDGLCYSEGYLYYEGWTNDSSFPRPLMRTKEDFSEEEKIGELPGSLITVRDGGVCLWMDWEKKRIMAGSVKNLWNPEGYYEYLKDGETGRNEKCRMECIEDGWLKWLKIELTDGTDETDEADEAEKEVFWLMVPTGVDF